MAMTIKEFRASKKEGRLSKWTGESYDDDHKVWVYGESYFIDINPNTGKEWLQIFNEEYVDKPLFELEEILYRFYLSENGEEVCYL